MCEALIPGSFSAANNVRHKVACQARRATMMPNEELEWSFNRYGSTRKTRLRVALNAVSQSEKAAMDTKRSFDGI